MYQIPDYINVSVALSEVLAELGVNDVVVNKMRRTRLVMETMETESLSMTNSKVRMYIFGSQSEGTTTRGLKSDVDTVICFGDMNVIHEWREWKHGVPNLLMVEAENTPPGYCMLQVLKQDAPVPETEIVDEHCFIERRSRIFLKNTFLIYRMAGRQEQHGPALAVQVPDYVPSFTCTSLPPVVQHWLSQLQRPWPSEDLKRYIANSPCFLVPVGSKGSVYETLEWRISTSLAERCLMFSLNVTQLQVYVLMKMLLKTSINYNVPKDSHISSFMCKTVMLHCVQNTASDAWQSHMLIQCLQFSLFTLYVCVVIENCPHFIIRSNNLMARRFTQQAKYQLQQNLQWLFDDILSRGILSLNMDDVASRLVVKLNPLMFGIRRSANDLQCQVTCAELLVSCLMTTQHCIKTVLSELTNSRPNEPIALLQQYVQRLEHDYMDGSMIERSACRLLAPYIYTTLGCILASESIQNSHTVSHQAIAFFSQGLNSDVASSRLKLASVFLCVGSIERAEIVLQALESRYDINICEPLCTCTSYTKVMLPARREALFLASDESDVPGITSVCVIFTRTEKNCIPQELHYEMYRSIPEELQYRKKSDFWMNWAVVDSLPYLHFLCYKVYSRLQRHAGQQRALYNLMVAIQTEPNLGHRETALNLLGQCMEQENSWNYALKCYSWSLNIRPRNNAAKFHVCRLLYILFRRQDADRHLGK